MKTRIKISIMIIMTFLSNYLYSQDCSDYYTKSKSVGKNFEKSGMSRGVTIKKGDTIEFSLSLYAGRTYYISVVGEETLGNIQIVLIDAENEIIYDNSVNEFKDNFVMSTEITTQLTLQVITQPEVYENETNTKYCAGLYVAYIKN